ncbi:MULTISPECIES: ABC transporter permease [unclassified Halomonas]|uniref:ABC transporter permease n=1 Tax=unclassified Halomonas TaxID=2609666 RepID=UPI001EF48CFB|nr:ABC transporter permease [Halomonas sp. MMH1-48]MCG7603613.1 ABC transporter permease [Halomonas sp. MM17-34]MCG7612915.1 ABC transporter permease [Halomonas sp. MM17-29]MCG7619464.1 ABC transporter permease [Halomonas sp. DSH1-27]
MRLAAWFTARLLRLVLVLLCVAAVSFGLMMLSPIDPVDAYLGPQMAQVSPEQRALIAEQWGFDAPAMVQFSHWLRQLLSGELGWSHIYNQPVSEVIGQRFQRSFFLLFGAWLLSLALGMLLGIAAGSKEGAWLDRLISGYAYITASTPTFWLAMLALLLFSVTLGWTPTCCAGPMGVLRQEVGPLTRLHHLILPMATLALLGMATITLHTRAKMVAFMRSETALHAFAQGASRFDIAWRHGLRHASLPAITLAFASLGELFGGSLLIEQVFAYPGLGQATVAAGLRSDVPLLLAIALFTALFVSMGSLIADGLYQLADPRIAQGQR